MNSKDYHLFLWHINAPDLPVRVGYFRSYEALDAAKATCDTTKAYHAEIYETQQTGSLVMVSEGNFGESGWAWVDHASPLSKHADVIAVVPAALVYQRVADVIESARSVLDNIPHAKSLSEIASFHREADEDLRLALRALKAFAEGPSPTSPT